MIAGERCDRTVPFPIAFVKNLMQLTQPVFELGLLIQHSTLITVTVIIHPWVYLLFQNSAKENPANHQGT